MKRRQRKRRRIAGYALAGAVTVLAAGLLYEALASARDARAYPPPGRLVAVDDAQLHLHCTGEGKPTVLLDAGGTESRREIGPRGQASIDVPG